MNTRSKKIIKDLEDKLVKTEAKAEHYEGKLRHTAEEMEIVYNVVENMFSKLGCEQLANTEILGSGGVSESNIMLYLGVVEQRKNEVINQYVALMHEDGMAAAAGRDKEEEEEEEYEDEGDYEEANEEGGEEPAGEDAE